MDTHKFGEIVGMQAEDYINFVEAIITNGHKEMVIDLLKAEGKDIIFLEKDVYDLLKSAIPTVQCACDCFGKCEQK